jgi:hypothetical protein
MAKELPYFQFEPAEYLTRDISFCSLEAQGLFVNICAYYWQRKCELTKEQLLKRLNYPTVFNELVEEGIIDLDNNEIKIKFLDFQYNKATDFSKEQSRKGSLGGRPKKPKESQIKPEINPNESQTKAIRKDKIKEDNIKQDNIPLINEFLSYLKLQTEFNYDAYLYSVTAKYEQWVANGWKDGNGNKIVNWKTKLKNTLPHLKPIYTNGQQPQTPIKPKFNFGTDDE